MLCCIFMQMSDEQGLSSWALFKKLSKIKVTPPSQAVLQVPTRLFVPVYYCVHNLNISIMYN